MSAKNRFQDRQLTVSDFYDHVLVVCPSCGKKAEAKANFEAHEARLLCRNCGLNKQVSTAHGKGFLEMEANAFFNARMWLEHPFKNQVFWAYNDRHLEYLEEIISADLRENKDRTGFTMMEKLSPFILSKNNRTPLLKIIRKLKNR